MAAAHAVPSFKLVLVGDGGTGKVLSSLVLASLFPHHFSLFGIASSLCSVEKMHNLHFFLPSVRLRCLVSHFGERLQNWAEFLVR